MTMTLAMKKAAAQEFATRMQSNAKEYALAQGIVQALGESEQVNFNLDDALADASLELQALVVADVEDSIALYGQIGRYAGFIFAHTDDYSHAKQQALREYAILCEMKEAGEIDGI
jgi:hypothetical protein